LTAGRYSIDPLGKEHDRDAFQCGTEELDRYLRQQAGQEGRRHVATSFVLIEPPEAQIIGYYTLSSASVDHDTWPLEIAQKLPRYPQMPVTLLGRLAVDGNHRGAGHGERLLMDALHRSWQVSRQVASMAVIVDAIDVKAREFYEAFDFVVFPDQERRLFLPMATVAMLFPG
jgi:predicted GNAT family N-acyltransferase